MNRDRMGRRTAQAEAFNIDRLSVKDDAIPSQRGTQELHHLAHPRRGVLELAAVPYFDDGLRSSTNAETKPPWRNLGNPSGGHRQRCRAARVNISDSNAHAHLGCSSHDREGRESVYA